MALFGKNKPVEYCAICGKQRKTGLLRGLFQTEIDGQYVCSDCFGAPDVQQEILSHMTMEQFKEYLAFSAENGKLKEQFAATGTIDFGDWNTVILFDRNNGFMSLDKNLEKTIFCRGELASFVIREDDAVIFEGNADGLACYESSIPNTILRVERVINEFRRECRMFESRIAAMSDEERRREEADRPRFFETEPFRAFHVDLVFDHPYWNKVTLDLDGPRFDTNYPDAGDYLSEYRCKYDVMGRLADELMAFGFPAPNPAAETSPKVAAEALLRFKELLDMGALTQEAFDAKKKQLLGL